MNDDDKVDENDDNDGVYYNVYLHFPNETFQKMKILYNALLPTHGLLL
jgi:hypothetical protein